MQQGPERIQRWQPIRNRLSSQAARGRAPLWLKIMAAQAGLSEPWIGDRVEAGSFWVAFDPDKQSGPRCIEVLFFVAPGNGEHVWQCLEPTCGVTVAF